MVASVESQGVGKREIMKKNQHERLLEGLSALSFGIAQAGVDTTSLPTA